MSLSKREKSFELLLKKIVRHGIKEAVQNKSTITEEDKEESKEEEPKKEEPKKEEPKKEEPKKEEPIESEAPVKADASALVDQSTLNLGVLKDELNTMRSGKSVDNAIVTQELQKYYNGLSSEERMTMYTYLNALAKILTGEVSADEAPDPSDVLDAAAAKNDSGVDKKLSDVVKKPSNVEDTSPPVKVSGQTEGIASESIRKFIKTLLTEEL
tara:strand:+ start:62 stop:700 length:639 start_codon:yes stop_codon:yes gene_type:complete